MRIATRPRSLLLLGALVAMGCRPGPSEVNAELPPSGSQVTTVAMVSAVPVASATVSAAAPVTLPTQESMKRGNVLAHEAEACYADLDCPADKAKALYKQADDTGATNVSCYRFYYGIAIDKDLVRARACFDRVVSLETGWQGSSPSLERVFLGVMLEDAQGGPRESARGDALFKDCYDSSDDSIGFTLKDRAKAGNTKPLDFCADVGGTTLDINACGSVDIERGELTAEVAAKDVIHDLSPDATGRTLWAAADRAWRSFATADATYFGDDSRGGTMRTAQENSVLASHVGERVAMLRALIDHATTATSVADWKKAVTEADKAVDKEEALSKKNARDAENKHLLADAQTAWRAYRTTEFAFVRHVLATRYGDEGRAESACAVELGKRRAVTLHHVGQ